ncbi:MAG: UvrD-helicase domain-containing protein, partial [Actinobacteria bacterium]|nr:UvrD-helicase domain-containing protein [Actinomycetota bacterium]
MSTTDLFDLTGELPTGRLAIEASAGTGKTFTLCALTVRFLAETDAAASNFLIVTFTRAATAELRGRIRDALVDAITYLEACVAARSAGRCDPSTPTDYLRTIASADVEDRLARLRIALTEYDAITITTIHSFAVQTIGSLGATSAFEAPRVFVENDSTVLRAVAADAIARHVANGMSVELVPKLSTVTKKIGSALRHGDLSVAPSSDLTIPKSTDADRALAAVVRDAAALLSRRRAARGEVTLNDSLIGLREVLRSPGRDTLIAALRARYQVALIDEFQDTDPVQWEIFETLFGTDASTLVFVGDPKQAIYGFRGADVATYVAATTAAGTRRAALGTNWRSDGRVLTALETLFTGTTFGEGIEFVSVDAAAHNIDRTLRRSDGSTPPALDIRVTVGDDLPRSKDGKSVPADAARRSIRNDLVARIHDALDHIEIPDGDGYRRLQPNDIAVLVASAHEATDVQERLLASGVPAVLSRAGDVLRSEAAEQWRWLLDALERPADPARTRRFALSWFGALSIAELDAATDATLDALTTQLAEWVHELRTHGTAEFVRRVFDDSHVLARVLGTVDGDRAATDLQHLGELFQTEIDTPRPGPAALLELLNRTDLATADVDDAGVASRRVETEKPSVQIMTMWVSKGLEFPIVFAPTMWGGAAADDNIGELDDGTRVIDLSAKSPFAALAKRRAIEERLRLIYVSLTRGRHQTVMYWTPPHQGRGNPMSRLLFARTPEGDIDETAFAENGPKSVPVDAEALHRALDPLVERSDGLIKISIVGDVRSAPRRTAVEATNADITLTPAELTRQIPRTTGRWSFSAIVAAEAAHSPEDPSLGDGGAADEGHATVTSEDDPIPEATPDTMPLGWLPAGAHFGTLVHSLYELVDFSSTNVETELAATLANELAWRDVDLTPRSLPGATRAMGEGLLVEGLARTMRTPLGPLFTDDAGTSLCLADFTPADRLDELDFELLLRPRAAGDSGALSDRDLGAAIARWITPDE